VEIINLLAYADDLVLLALSWHGLQNLLNIIENAANNVKMSFKTKKTVCMIINPCSKHKIVCSSFPAFSIADCNLLFVEHFTYLGHIIENSMSDDSDINRELNCLFVRANLLCRRFHRCTLQVKLKLFRAFCICFYDAASWYN
jgi:Reverse transcriptase (RNA-dependent DNA polymerase)